jgi:hypothetical protein
VSSEEQRTPSKQSGGTRKVLVPSRGTRWMTQQMSEYEIACRAGKKDETERKQ